MSVTSKIATFWRGWEKGAVACVGLAFGAALWAIISLVVAAIILFIFYRDTSDRDIYKLAIIISILLIPKPIYELMEFIVEENKTDDKNHRQMTRTENLLWIELQKRPNGHKFRKQVPMLRDAPAFECQLARLAISVVDDGYSVEDEPIKETARYQIVTEQGARTIRLPAKELLYNMEKCVLAIVEACEGVLR